MNRIALLQAMANRFGDFKIAFAEGDRWSKHESVLGLCEKGEWYKLSRANNRQIHAAEVVLDIDDANAEQKAKVIMDWLDARGFEYSAWRSGGKGIHIHLIFPQMLLYGEAYRKKVRAFLIEQFGTDAIKSSEKVMIALEYSPHRHSGRLKLPIAGKVDYE